jgi:hypothetical protein
MIAGSLSTTATTRIPRSWSRRMQVALESATRRSQPQGSVLLPGLIGSYSRTYVLASWP